MGDENAVYQGGCLCGRVRYEVEGPPKRVSHCHCTTCRRANAAAFATGAAFDPAKFRFTKGEPKIYASSDVAERSFCPDCGSQLVFRYRDGEAISVWLATFDDPEALAPMRHIWTSSRLGWIHLDDGLPTFPKEGATRPPSED